MLLLGLIVLFTQFRTHGGFMDRQLNFPRVKLAYVKKEGILRYFLSNAGVDKYAFDLYIRGFKQEEDLEVWVKNKNEQQYKLLETYRFCTNSGIAGPKRKKGDGQIPEGYYQVSVFNPESNYLLSLGLNYPNRSDSILGGRVALGGDIYIHGGCESIGCIPVTNDKIEELYLLAAMAKSSGQSSIPVHIFPNRMNAANTRFLMENFSNNGLQKFWENIRKGYLWFEETGTLPEMKINSAGYYDMVHLRH